MNVRAVSLGLSLLILSSAAVAAEPACQPSIDKAWVRAAPPGATMMAGYAVLRNSCATPFVVDGIAAGDFAMSMIHETQIQDGVSQMRHAGLLSLPAHGQLVFAPGGRHLMLMHPKRVLKEGDKVRLTLKLAGGRDISADFIVRKDPPL
jgi:copper(I)-binding protein